MKKLDLPKDGKEKAARDRNWAGWTNTAKPYDPNKPFHRINCPTFKSEEVLRDGENEADRQLRTDNLRADGQGLLLGCKIPTEMPLDGLVENVLFLLKSDVRRVVRAIPGWVPVDDKLPFQEIEGILIRSYQTWTDVPLLQWHRWYDWNLLLNPAPGYGHLRSLANRPPKFPN